MACLNYLQECAQILDFLMSQIYMICLTVKSMFTICKDYI